MLTLSGNNQVNIIKTFNSTSTYLDYRLNIDYIYFGQMVSLSQVYPTELKLMKANSFDTEVLLINLNLSITNGIVSS